MTLVARTEVVRVEERDRGQRDLHRWAEVFQERAFGDRSESVGVPLQALERPSPESWGERAQCKQRGRPGVKRTRS